MASIDSGAFAPQNFSDLASQSLSMVNDANTMSKTPQWNVSLGELKASSNNSTEPENMSGDGGSMLSFNLGKAFSRIKEPEKNAGSIAVQKDSDELDDKENGKAGMSLQDSLAKHQQSILESVLTHERLAIRAKSQSLVDRCIEEAWGQERNRCLMEVAGHHSIGSPTVPSRYTHSSAEPHRSLMMGSLPSSSDPSERSYSRTAALGASLTKPSSSIPERRTVQSHIDLVARLNRNKDWDAFAEFLRVAENKETPPSPRWSAYGTAWRLLQSMVCPRRADPLSNAMGALAYFSRQFQVHATTRVRAATGAGHNLSNLDRSPHDMGSIVTAYVKLEVGTIASPWPSVYYSLRCGDAKGALNIINAQGGSVEPVVVRVLSRLSSVQSSATCLWDCPAVPPIPDEDRQQLVNLFHGAKANGDSYRVASLSLLSLAEPLAASEVVKTVEDYMFGMLWEAVQNANPVERIAKIGDSIKKWGPSYFDETEDSGGWAYALPLLAVQRYHSAFSYLTETGGYIGLLQATHLALVLSHSGIKLVDLGQVEPPSESVLSVLLVSYANFLRTVNALAALEYLVHVPESARKRKEICNHVVESRAFGLLGALSSRDVSEEQTVHNVLGSLFQGQVSSILADAAGEAANRGNVKDAAELLFLAGRYSALLRLLNKQLAFHLGGSPGEEQTFWLQAARRFQALHLENGRTPALEVLEAENALGLVNTLKLLIDLMCFVDLLNQGNFVEAWSLVEKLGLLPATASDVSLKEKQFHSLDVVVQHPFSVVLLGAMKSLYEQYLMLGVTTQGFQSDSSAGATRQRLSELRSRARLLVHFAGLIQMPDGGKAAVWMAEMEAHMT